MRVFIAGATGVLGSRLVQKLADRGHDVVGLVRDDAGADSVADAGGTPVYGDILECDTLVDGAERADVVVHAATAIPAGTDPSEADWERNDRVRRVGARNLTAAADAVGASRYLQQSVTWVARQPDGSQFDESARPHPDRTTQSALDAERIARDAGEEFGFAVGVLRGGWFYGPDASHTRQLGEQLLARRLPILGGGLLGRRDADISMVHVDDAAAAFVAAAESDATGTWHVVDDDPVSLAAFLRALADRLDAPSPWRVPAWAVTPFVGANTVRFFTRPAATTNEKATRELDWEPQYPTYREGLDQVVRAWRAEGVLVEAGENTEWETGERRVEAE